MIDTLFGDPVVTVTATPAMFSGALLPEEAACVERAVAKRRREFTAGRLCAREALAKLGVHGFPLVVGEARVPVWPQDVVGSITHCAGYCGVAVARRGPVLGLGLDVERAEALEPELLARIATAEERRRLADLPAREGSPDWGKLTFCAKESFYKCYFPLARAFLGFQDVEIAFEAEARRFRGRLLRADAPAVCGLRELEGRFAWSPELVFAGVTLAGPPEAVGIG
jgi:4'-phosphopantetheinyl transferase EntD